MLATIGIVTTCMLYVQSLLCRHPLPCPISSFLCMEQAFYLHLNRKERNGNVTFFGCYFSTVLCTVQLTWKVNTTRVFPTGDPRGPIIYLTWVNNFLHAGAVNPPAYARAYSFIKNLFACSKYANYRMSMRLFNCVFFVVLSAATITVPGH